ncbi:MAG: M28 family peptidase [Thermodesulfobacteriota bacterium]
MVENPPLVLPQTFMRSFATWWHDPANEIETHVQTILFGAPARALLETQIEAGAGAFVGIVRTPWETDRLYAPYDAEPRDVPAVWISAANGDRLLALLRGGRARGRLRAASSVAEATSHNVTGVLRGPSDDWVIVGSHHDGPWASAVEDASGVALVLAQARYWAGIPEIERPHNLLFLLNAGHMAGGAGLRRFTTVNEAFIRERVVLELHLEHVAREARVEDARLVPTDAPEWRWWFTSFIPPLEEIVADAICREDLGRSLLMPPQGFPPGNARPPTDAARFHPLSPIVSLLSAPMYLFDPADTVEMVHEESLVPLTRAAVRIVDATGDHTAAGLRARVYERPRPAPLPPCEEPES